MVADLLNVSRRLAAAGDFVGAREKAEAASNEAETDQEFFESDEWLSELKEREAAQFMDALGAASADEAKPVSQVAPVDTTSMGPATPMNEGAITVIDARPSTVVIEYAAAAA